MPNACQSPPPFSWSYSRHRTLAECPRRYYYRYYLSHNGWRPSAAGRQRLAHVLKRLMTLPMLVGTLVHAGAQELAHAARARRGLPTLEALWARARAELRAVCARGAPVAGDDDTPRTPRLLEQYYHGPITRDQLARAEEQTHTALQTLHASPVWAELGALGRNDVLVRLAPMHFAVDDVRVWAVPDLVYRDAGGWSVLDWKLRPSADAPSQVTLYTAALERGLGLVDPADVVRARVVTLLTDEDCTEWVTPAGRAAALEWVRGSVARMRALQADRERNVPLPERAFPLAARWSACGQCPFLHLCARELGLTDGPATPTHETRSRGKPRTM